MQDISSQMKLGDVNIMDKILSEQDRIIWESMGLTPDVQSMENATFLTKVCILRNKIFIVNKTQVEIPSLSLDIDNCIWNNAHPSSKRSD